MSKCLFLYNLYGLFGLFAAFKTYQLAMDGRYLSFPSAATNIAVFGLLGLMLIRTVTASGWTYQTMGLNHLLGNTEHNLLQNKLIGGALLLIGLALIVGETHGFVMSGDLIAEQPEFSPRLWLSLQFTLMNGQLLGWLASLTVLTVPLWITEDEKTV